VNEEEPEMRVSHGLSIAAVVLIPIIASAQQATPPEVVAVGTGPNGGFIDFGLRGTSVSGEPARYERYRDLGDGAFLGGLRMNREANGWVMTAGADNVGRRDQRFDGEFVRPGKFKGYAMWDQIPMLLSRTTKTLFTENFDNPQGVLTIADGLQSQVQGAPTSILQAFNSSAREFETKSRRHRGRGEFEYMATPALTIRSTVQYTDRQGTLPYGGSFGHGSLVEMPAPINHRLADVDAGAEYSSGPLMLRAGYAGSFFHNENTTVTFDNPFRLTDIAGTPSRGRSSLPPSNSFVSVNGMASVKMPGRSRATAYVSVGQLKDAGDPLMPQTVNSANVPAPLERDRVNGEGRTSSVNLTFVSRPTRYADVSVRYRSYDYDNRTPAFNMTQRVGYDNAPSTLATPVHTEAFGVVRHSLDADFRLTALRFATAGIGFSRLEEERSHRIFESTTENVARVTFDAVGHGWFSLRTKFEHAERRGEGIEHGELELAAINEQPGMRHYDIAPRDRNRVTVLGSVTPSGMVSFYASVAAGKDDYRLELPQTATPPESLFGLRDNMHQVVTFGVDAVPSDLVNVGASYSFEHYNALNRSRQANPGAEFVDPRRNWSAEGTDHVHSVILFAGVNKIADKVDLQFNYDFNRARAVYEYIAGAVANRTLPEETVITTALPPPTALPIVKSDLGRGAVDLMYALTSHVGLGVSWWYEQYRVTDFTLDAEANPELARGQAVLLGYLYRPYTANTVWGRMVYRW
jgi:MtrB/PioB family decaheme-associated outer membrane protein